MHQVGVKERIARRQLDRAAVLRHGLFDLSARVQAGGKIVERRSIVGPQLRRPRETTPRPRRPGPICAAQFPGVRAFRHCRVGAGQALRTRTSANGRLPCDCKRAGQTQIAPRHPADRCERCRDNRRLLRRVCPSFCMHRAQAVAAPTCSRDRPPGRAKTLGRRVGSCPWTFTNQAEVDLRRRIIGLDVESPVRNAECRFGQLARDP